MHALLEPGIAGARGIEIDRIKCDKAVAFLRQATLELQRRGVAGADALVLPQIECSPIEKVLGSCMGQGLRLWFAAVAKTAQATCRWPGMAAAACWLALPFSICRCFFSCRALPTCLPACAAAGGQPGPLHPRLLLLGGRACGGQGRLWPPLCRLAHAAVGGGRAARHQVGTLL